MKCLFHARTSWPTTFDSIRKVLNTYILTVGPVHTETWVDAPSACFSVVLCQQRFRNGPSLRWLPNSYLIQQRNWQRNVPSSVTLKISAFLPTQCNYMSRKSVTTNTNYIATWHSTGSRWSLLWRIIWAKYIIYIYIQCVPGGGMCQTSGECSLF